MHLRKINWKRRLIENRLTSSSSPISSASSTKSLSPPNEHQIETPRKKTRRNNASSSNSLNTDNIRIFLTKTSNGNLILYDLVIHDLELFLNLILNLQTIISSSDYVYLVNKNFVKIENSRILI